MRKKAKRWTAQEDKVLLEQINAMPQNLAKCFIIVSEKIQRSPGAIANHWYQKLSKDPNIYVYATISPKHVTKNRKNGKGVESTPKIWQRVLRIIKGLFK